MKCPYCGKEQDKVIDSRGVQEGKAVRRRRQCLACAKRFTTYEYVENVSLMIVKNDGRREPFDRQKLKTGIELACKKRPVGSKKIEAMVEEIEEKLLALSKGEIEAPVIGELVMEKLLETDEVAYVRFASVYRKFKDKEQFLQELKNLLGS